jgi:peptide deformylase
MAILELVTYPDSRLKKVAKPVTCFDEKLSKLVNDMVDTMYAESGIGLAAPQIGISSRIVVMDLSEEQDSPDVLINPEIIAAEGEIAFEEGCLSVPGIRKEVLRYYHILVEAADIEGNLRHIEAEGLHAVCVQHEIDHLDGILFIDRLSDEEKAAVAAEINARAEAVECAES